MTTPCVLLIQYHYYGKSVNTATILTVVSYCQYLLQSITYCINYYKISFHTDSNYNRSDIEFYL